MRLKLVANLWTLTGHPGPTREWSIDRKVRAASAAGFDALTGALDAGCVRMAVDAGMEPVGWFWAYDARHIREEVRVLSGLGVRRATVFLGRHNTPEETAIKLALELHRRSESAGILCATETHRDTATESPEKTQAILAGFRRATGREMAVTWDFSHHAVVKHLAPGQWEGRFVTPFRRGIVAAELFHFRPFNGHHAQIPVRVSGRKTPEMRAFLEFVTGVMRLWRLSPENAGRTFYACPEVGPVCDGYGLSHDMPPWSQAVLLADDLKACWRAAGRGSGAIVGAPPP